MYTRGSSIPRARALNSFLINLLGIGGKILKTRLESVLRKKFSGKPGLVVGDPAHSRGVETR